MNQVTSKDGTTIAFDQLGHGPAVILVSGGSVDRSSNAPLSALLAEHFTVFNYDRRGRGPSGDTLPYAVKREIEDIAAVADAAGGSAYLFGSSSGAALALEAASQLGFITKLALWEPPYRLDRAARPPADMAQTFHELVAAGKRDEAVEYFMTKGSICHRSSSPPPKPSPSGRDRSPWPIPWNTTLASWATIRCLREVWLPSTSPP